MSYWLCLFVALLVLYLAVRTRRTCGFHRAAVRRRERGERPVMEEIILKLMGKGVHITTINDTMTGKLTRYAEGWLTLTDAKGREQYVNADYVIRLKESRIKY